MVKTCQSLESALYEKVDSSVTESLGLTMKLIIPNTEIEFSAITILEMLGETLFLDD